MGVVYTNNAETTLAAAISSTSATSISVTSSSTFPTLGSGEYFYATISDGTNLEIVKVTAVSGTTWTIVRASDNTTARTFANGSSVQLRMTAALLEDIQDNMQSSNLTVDTFTATSNQTAFTLSEAPAAESNLVVFIDGVFQNQAAYTISNNTLTLDTGVVSGRTVTVYVVNPLNIGTPSDGTVTSAKLSGNITMPGTLTVGSHDVAFDSPTFVVDNSNSRVGLGTASPSVPVDIVGEVKTSSHINIGGNLVKASGDLTLDVDGDIVLDADGADIKLLNGGTHWGSIYTNATPANLYIQNMISDGDIYLSGSDGGSNINALVIDMSNAGAAQFNSNVGIGVAPTSTLHLKNGGRDLNFTLADSPASGDAGVQITAGASDFLGIFAGSSNGELLLGSNGAEKMRIDATGNVDLLQSNHLRWKHAAGGTIRGSIDADSNDNLMFYTGSSETEKMRIKGDGNVGIGDNDPPYKLSVSGTGGTRIMVENTDTNWAAVDIRAGGNQSNYIFFKDDSGERARIQVLDSNDIAISTGDSPTERMRILANGNVGIGTTSPQQKLDVNGEIIALSANITDSAGNTSIGYGALHNLTSGDSNIALGYEALEDVTSGIHNVGLGYRAGMNITTGQYNVAVGNYALSTNTTGGWNTCIGYGAGNTMSGNDHNTCIGRNAGYNITSGGSNTIIGSQAGDAQTSAHNNTFVGTRAGTSATTGNGYNTAIGVDALEDCTTGSFNVSLGTNCIKNVTTGANNIGVGYRAGNAGQPGGQITSQSNIACIGDTAITSLNCQVSLSVASDERDKTDFTALDLGLDFVKSLQPYTFRWDKRSSYVDWDKNPDTDLLTVTHDGTHKEAQLDIGFKAQDVEKLEKSAGYNRTNKTNLTYALSPDGKTYSMKYEKLVPVLVKAIQELEAKVAKLESK